MKYPNHKVKASTTMSQNPIEFSQDEIDRAVEQEERERLMAENQALKNRVVTLRALLNRAQQPTPVAVGEGVAPSDEPEQNQNVEGDVPSA